MCLADFINIHWYEIMKVSLEVELGVRRNYLKQFVNSVQVICVKSCSMNTVETAGCVSQVAAPKGREG